MTIMKTNFKPMVMAGLIMSATLGSTFAQMPALDCGNKGGGGPGGCGCPPNCNSTGGVAPKQSVGANPFRLYGGNLFREVSDVKLFGLQQLELKRYYNSRLDRNSVGFGGGATWSHNYAWVMAGAGTNTATGNPLLSVDFPTGETYTYERTATNEWRTIYGVDSWVQQSGTNYTLRFGNGWAYKFGKQSSGSYRFLSYADPQLLTYTLTYNSSGRITEIDDPTGQYLKFNWMTFTPPGGSSTTVISNVVAGNNGTAVAMTAKYTYTNLMDGGAVVVALAGVIYSDGSTATYKYWQETTNSSRNLLAEAIDPRYLGTATHMKYEYWPNGDAVDGRVYRELNGATGEEILHAGRYSSLAVADAIYANGAHERYKFPAAAYDYGDKVEWIQNASGDKTYYVYGDGGNGYLIRETNALGYVTKYGRDALGRVTSRTNADNSTEFWTYDAVGNELTHTDELGRVTTTTRDSLGRATKITYPDNSWEGFSYDSNNQPLTRTNRNGGVETMTYLNGCIITHTDAMGGLARYSYRWRLPAAITNALGQVTRMGYDERGLMTALTNADLSYVRYDYDDFGNRIAMTNELGKVTRWTYDEFKRMTSMVDPLNRTNLYSYDFVVPGSGGCGCANTANKPSLVTSPGGIDTAYIYDEEWRVVSTISAYGTAEAAETQTEYDAVGNVTKTISPDGQTNSFTYDKRNRRLTAKDPLGRITRWTNDVAGQVIAIVAPDGGVTRFGYDTMGRVVAETNALGGVTRNVYDLAGNVLETYDALGRGTTNQYDLLERVVRMFNPDGTTTGTRYNAVGSILARTNELGNVWRYTYDTLNRQTAAIDPLNRTNNTIYGPGNGVPGALASVSPAGQVTTNLFDDAGQRIATTAGFGTADAATTQFEYNLDGQLAVMVDGIGKRWTNFYSAAGRLVATADPLGHVTTTTYSLDGKKLRVTLPDNTSMSYGYDAAGQLRFETNALGDRIIYGYNAVGSMTNLTDTKGNVTRWTYDLLGRQTAKIYADTTGDTFSYDAAGNLIGVTNAAGQVVSHEYDRRNRLTNSAWSSGSAPTITRSYDAAGRVLSINNQLSTLDYAYDIANQLLAETNTVGGISRVVSYGYDANGWRRLLGYPSGNTLTNTFTARGQLQAIYAPAPPPLASFTYNGNGQRLTKALQNGVTSTYTHDDAGRLTSLAHTTGSGTVASFNYAYNDVNNRTSVQREDMRTETYGYDNNQQLTAADYGDTTGEGFNYDKMGNLQSRTGVSPVSTFTANNLNQYTAVDGNSATYDPKGNLTAINYPLSSINYSYDGQNRLTAVTRGANTASFVYDGRNRCVQRTINSVTTDYVYDDWRLIAEYTGSTPVCEYIHGPDMDEVLARVDGTGTLYYSGDALNSTAALTDWSGNVVERYRYTAFGQPTILDASFSILAVSAYGNRFAFQGREYFAELNLTDHRNRYYSPELQRWLNRDPIGELGFETARRRKSSILAGGPNRYRFLKNSAVNFVDSLGLKSTKSCKPDDEKRILDSLKNACQQFESSGPKNNNQVCCLRKKLPEDPGDPAGLALVAIRKFCKDKVNSGKVQIECDYSDSGANCKGNVAWGDHDSSITFCSSYFDGQAAKDGYNDNCVAIHEIAHWGFGTSTSEMDNASLYDSCFGCPGRKHLKQKGE